MTKYLLTNNDKDCYGCRACEQICPQHAISIKPNEEGFLYPVLEANKCVNCGLCVKVCPIENVSETNTPIAVYAAQFKNEEELLAEQDDPQKYNDEVLFPDKVRINIEYLDNWSFWYDIKIIIYTVLGKDL